METELIPGIESGTNSEGNIAVDIGCVHRRQILLNKISRGDVCKTEILDFCDQGFLLSKLMTEEECSKIIEEGENIGFNTIKGARDDYRSQERITIDSEELASSLWMRIEPYLSEITIKGDNYKDLHIHGVPFLLEGKWKPIRLNNYFRVGRYLPGGHFAPHFDGFYSKDSEERSLKTCMIYLNGDFDGGSTNFIDESQKLYKNNEGKYCAEEEHILCRIKPETGLTILFNHHRLHEGEQLRSGKKYILRTDVMYKKENTKTLDEKQEKALSLIQEAERLEAQGECMAAAELYRKAFKLAPELESCY